ncbi:hypothetical protein Tco_1139005 [Tanacetum coccineum]
MKKKFCQSLCPTIRNIGLQGRQNAGRKSHIQHLQVVVNEMYKRFGEQGSASPMAARILIWEEVYVLMSRLILIGGGIGHGAVWLALWWVQDKGVVLLKGVRDIGEFWKVYTQYGFAFSGFAVVVVRRNVRLSKEEEKDFQMSNKRVLKVNGLPPIPFMHSPPRPNPKWYTIMLDKRLDHDGRGIKEAQINDTYVGADACMATFVAIVMDNHYPRLELTLSSSCEETCKWHLKAANETSKEGKSNAVINDNEHFLEKVAVAADEVGIPEKASQKQSL